MTQERRKAILFLTLTLVVGIAIGSLAPASFSRFQRNSSLESRDNDQENDNRNDRNDERDRDRETNSREDSLRPLSNDRFVSILFRYVQPDSTQAQQIESFGIETSGQIDSIQDSYNQSVVSILDTLRANLRPILSEEQQESLNRMISRTFRGRGGAPSRGN